MIQNGFSVYFCAFHIRLSLHFSVNLLLSDIFSGISVSFRLCRVFVCRTIFNQFLQSSQPEIRNEKRAPKKEENWPDRLFIFFIFWLAQRFFNVFALVLAFIFTLTLALLAISLIR